MGAGATMGSCMRHLPFHVGGRRRPESTTLTPEMAKYNNRVRQRLHGLGFTKIIIAGKSNYTFTIDGKKQDASQWKKALVLHDPAWGIDVPACRVQGHSPTFGSILLFFFQKSTTRSYS